MVDGDARAPRICIVIKGIFVEDLTKGAKDPTSANRDQSGDDGVVLHHSSVSYIEAREYGRKARTRIRLTGVVSRQSDCTTALKTLVMVVGLMPILKLRLPMLEMKM